jgi:hypothetical protein
VKTLSAAFAKGAVEEIVVGLRNPLRRPSLLLFVRRREFVPSDEDAQCVALSPDCWAGGYLLTSK